MAKRKLKKSVEKRKLNKVIVVLETSEPVSIDLEEIRNQVIKNIEANQVYLTQRFDEHHKVLRIYAPNDLVIIRRDLAATGEPKKLTPLYKNPYMVPEVLPNDRYVDIPGAERTQRNFSVGEDEAMMFSSLRRRRRRRRRGRR